MTRADQMAQNQPVGTSGPASPAEMLFMTPRAKAAIDLAVQEAQKLGDEFVGTEHLLLGIFLEGEGPGSAILRDVGMTEDGLRRALAQVRATGTDYEAAATGESMLKKYTRDLTAHGARGQARPRHRARRGDQARHPGAAAGAPRTTRSSSASRAWARRPSPTGWRRRSSTPTCPRSLRGKRVLALDLGGMVAGSKFRGEFEERLKGVLDEIQRSRDVVLFIDELHTVVGAGAAEGAIDARNMMKPMLARGELQCVGRDDARRVPRAHREGRGARAPLPAHLRRRAERRGDDRHPRGPARQVRGASQGDDHRRRHARGRGRAVRPLHQRPVPARQGHRPDRRGGEQAAHRGHDAAARPARHGAASCRTSRARERPRCRLRTTSAPPSSRSRRDKIQQHVRDGQGRLAGRQGHRRRDVDADDIAERGEQVDRHPGAAHAAGGGRQAARHGGEPARARGRPGARRGGRQRGGAPRPRRPQGPEAADRLLHLPGPDRRGQDRAGAGAGRVPVRRRGAHDPPRHVRVHGEAHRLAAGRRAARLRGLRRGRPAHRGGAPAALQRGPLRRDREGAPRRVQRPPADPGRRAADRRQGPHGGLQEHRHHHDQQRRRRGSSASSASASPPETEEAEPRATREAAAWTSCARPSGPSSSTAWTR